MRSAARRKLALGALGALALAGLVLVLAAPGRGQTGAAAAGGYEKRLSQINARIKDLQAKLDTEQKRRATLLSALEQIGLTKQIIRAEISSQNVMLARTTSELAALRREIARLRERLEKERRAAETTLVTLYKHGRLDLLRFILQAKDIGSVLAESKRLTLLARQQERAVSAYLGTLGELQAGEAGLEAKKAETGRIIKTMAERRGGPRDRGAGRTGPSSARSNGTGRLRRDLDDLRERARQLQALIQRLLSQEEPLPFTVIPLDERQGRLPWPLGGRVITTFGPQRHPRFNTLTVNNGIEVVPGKDGKTVRAVHPGRVAYADYFEGYGNLLIIDHGLAYYTLYGHLADFLVAKGDAVRAEQPVGVAGDTGSLRGECLYFEIRFRAKALDPLQWLKRK
jgi:septal ring factor EnvC (AmiA/AmiB activator)